MKAILLAAGFGTRMLPITKAIPKEMLPVGNKPVIEYIVQGLSMAGIDEIIIVLSTGKQAIIDYFSPHPVLEQKLSEKNKTDALHAVQQSSQYAKLTFVMQHEMKGTGHAILQALPWIGDEAAMVVYADTIYHPDIFGSILAHERADDEAAMALTPVPWETVHKYGIATVHDGKLRNFVEKPSREEVPSNLATFSPYIVPPSFFGELAHTKPDDNSGEIYPRPALDQLMNADKVHAVVSDAPVRDTGTPDAWMQANRDSEKIRECFV